MAGKLKPISIGLMARGFSGMLSYYAIIGIMLGIFALCIGGPLAVTRLLSDNERARVHANDPRYQPDKNTPPWLSAYVGKYDRHGQALDISPDGHGIYRSRTYTTCDEEPQEPCEKQLGDMPLRVEFMIVQSGDGVVARTADSEIPVILIKPGVVTYGGDTFCTAAVDPSDPAAEACGA